MIMENQKPISRSLALSIRAFSKVCHVAKIPAQPMIQGRHHFRVHTEVVLITMAIFDADHVP